MRINKNSFFGNKIYTAGFWGMYYFNRVKLSTKKNFDLLKGYISAKIKKVERYPSTIQLPITYKCNFDCIMCGMHHLIDKADFSHEELAQILSDKLFSRVKVVGINGGEPFLKKDLVECVKVMITNLPCLEQLNIISNGFFTNLIYEKMSEIYAICSNNNIKVNISFSVDGINEMQDFMRGRKKAWEAVNNTVTMLKNGNKKCFDHMGIICTITKYNVFRLSEVEKWAEKKNIYVSYNIATVNARIDNYDKVEDFSLLNDTKAKLVAREFFYKKAIVEKSKIYFALYLFLKNGKRYAPCACQYNNWVTLTPNKQISYCATHSKELGDASKESAYNIFNGNIPYLNSIVSEKCSTCSHYISTLNLEGRKLFYKELLNNMRILR